MIRFMIYIYISGVSHAVLPKFASFFAKYCHVEICLMY